jgi:hypothetical protein
MKISTKFLEVAVYVLGKTPNKLGGIYRTLVWGSCLYYLNLIFFLLKFVKTA